MKNTKLEHIEFDSGYNLETIDCPLCGGYGFRKLLYEQKIPVVKCLGCGLIMANPRPTREGLQRFYEQYFPPESAPLWQKQMAKIFLKEGWDRIREYQNRNVIRLGTAPKILDIGCGMGFFLELMREKGWEVQGIEPAPAAVKHAREALHLSVFEGTVEQFIPKELYDVVTLWYVLEHVPNPHEILNRAKDLLKEGGLLIVRVPNQNAPIDVWLNRFGLQQFFLMNPPRHLFDYSPHTIGKLLENRHFKVLDIRNGIPRGTGTLLELMRRHLWYGLFEGLYHLTGGRVLRGSSITVYAQKK